MACGHADRLWHREQSIEAMKLGAVDFLEKPFEPKTIQLLCQQILERQRIGTRGPGRVVRAERRVSHAVQYCMALEAQPSFEAAPAALTRLGRLRRFF